MSLRKNRVAGKAAPSDPRLVQHEQAGEVHRQLLERQQPPRSASTPTAVEDGLELGAWPARILALTVRASLVWHAAGDLRRSGAGTAERS